MGIGSFDMRYAKTVTTRPNNTTAYTANDVIGAADATTPANAGSAIITLPQMGFESGVILLRSVRLKFSDTSVPAGMTTFRVWFYNTSPTAILDNAAWPGVLAADTDNYTGVYVDLPAAADQGDIVDTYVSEVNREIDLAVGSTTIYAIIQTIGGYTPAASSTITLEAAAMAV